MVGGGGHRPEAVLAVAQELERASGRHRDRRNEPRTLDIDLLVFEGLISDDPRLLLPHPRLRQRRFVLAPLADIAPDLPVPPNGARVADLLAAVGQENGVERIGWPPELARRLGLVLAPGRTGGDG